MEAHRHDTVGRLLVALFWLRCYPTCEVLGVFFGGLHKQDVPPNVRGVLAVLGLTHTFPFDRPGKDRRRLSSAEQVTAAFPAVRLVVDAKGQRVQRPGGAYEVRRPFYSGKRTCHTAETQFAVPPDGQIEAVSDSHPGGATHDATLLIRTKLLDRLAHAAGEAAMVDKGYVLVKKHLPGRPLVIPTKGIRDHPLTDGQRAANQMIAKHRIVVEHTIAQVNRFTVLRQVFRRRVAHHPTRHRQVMRVVAGLVNLRNWRTGLSPRGRSLRTRAETTYPFSDGPEGPAANAEDRPPEPGPPGRRSTGEVQTGNLLAQILNGL